jgi:tetratricopeptide (TPR) repeat protein
MQRLTSLKVGSIFAAWLIGLTNSCAIGSNGTGSDVQTLKAVSLYKDGKLQDAVSLEEDAVKSDPKNWLRHATMSYLYWQQGNIIDAVTEGMKATKLAPDSEIAILNLAHMDEAMSNFEAAIPLYESARKVAPDDWVPWVCLARCYIKSDRMSDGLVVLREMSQRKSSNYDWNYQLGTLYLAVNQPQLAIAPMSEAAALAVKSEQKSDSAVHLLMALIRDNQLDRARAMKDEVFNNYKPKESELYVRTASALLSADDPESGHSFLKLASANLGAIRDSDGFFRLGKIFEEKATQVSDSNKQAAWLGTAQAAFNQAIELNPGLSAYHLALAGVYSRLGKTREMNDSLTEVRALDKFDLLTAYLDASAKGDKNPPANSGNNETAKTSESAAGVNLTAVHFRLKNLPCACLISKIDNTLSHIKGVAFVNVSRLKPYDGNILVDESVIKVKDVFGEWSKNAAELAGAMKAPEPIEFEVVTQQPVNSLDAAVRISQSVKFGDVLNFPKQLELLPPVIPVTLVSERSGSTI